MRKQQAGGHRFVERVGQELDSVHGGTPECGRAFNDR